MKILSFREKPLGEKEMLPQWIKDQWKDEEDKKILASIPKDYWNNARIRELIHDRVMAIGN